MIHALFGPISHHLFAQIHFLVRKSAHFFSYGLLSGFAFFSWRATWPAPQRWHIRWAALALLTAFAAGGGDEFHQRFIPSRGSSFHDVLLDTTGAFFFQLAIALWINFRENRANR